MKTVSLGEVVTFKGGGTPSRVKEDYWNGGIPWATVKDFNSGFSLNSTQENISELGLRESASNLIPRGTLIIPTRMGLGKAVISNIDIAINQDLKAVIPTTEDVDVRYLLWFFIANSREFEKMGKGATVKGITLDQLRKFQIPLPPLPIQKKIAAVLEKADELRRKREEQIKRLDDLLQATFLDMFGDIFNDSKCIEKAEFGQFIRSIRYGTGSPPEFSQTGIPFIRATNVKERTIKSQGMAFISAEEARKIEKCRVSEGDLIIVRSGANTGDCARIPKAFDQAYGGYDLIIEIDEPYSSFYNYFFSTPSARLVIDGLSRRAGQPHLNAEQVKTFPVLVPVDSDMQKFVKILIETEKMAESIVSRQKIHANLFNSLMQRAFKGELDLK